VIGTRRMNQSAQQLGVSETQTTPLHPEIVPHSHPSYGFAVAGIKMTKKVVGDNNHTRRNRHSHFKHRACRAPF
jgi:hypothetical protein